MIGKVCACTHGIIGIVTKKLKTNSGRILYSGISIDGSAWQSLSPTVIANSLSEYINQCVEKKVYAKLHRLRPRHFTTLV